MKLLRLSITLLFGLAFTGQMLAQQVSRVKAIQNKNVITLMWTVSNEPTQYICFVEMSTDGKHFELIGKVKGQSSYMDKQYFYQVKGFAQQKLWFRIKKVPVNASATYSQIVQLNTRPENSLSTVYTQVVED